jgi:hypothetical protein
MSASSLRVAKTETRDLADRERVWGRDSQRQLGDTCEWRMTNATFFAAFVVIAAVIAIFALVMR